MDFGRLPDEAHVDWTLPPDPFANAAVLAGQRVAQPQVFVGCPSWNHPEWIGRVYPPGPKSRKFLPFYTHQFNSVEVNAGAYGMVTEAQLLDWRNAATPGFQFCIKFPQGVTHRGGLTGKEGLAIEFLDRLRTHLPAHLGPPLLQFGDNFAPKNLPSLLAFLRALPSDWQLAVEMRHPGWFEDTAWLDAIQALGHIAVITDTAGRRDVLHMRLTVPRTFVRFTVHSKTLPGPQEFRRLDDWIIRCQQWLDKGLDTLYFFVHSPDKIYAPELAVYFIEKLNAKTGLQVKTPKPVSLV